MSRMKFDLSVSSGSARAASTADSARELADLFCAQARRRIDALFHALWFNDDDQGYATAMGILDGRHTWIEEGLIDPSDVGAPTAEPAAV